MKTQAILSTLELTKFAYHTDCHGQLRHLLLVTLVVFFAAIGPITSLGQNVDSTNVIDGKVVEFSDVDTDIHNIQAIDAADPKFIVDSTATVIAVDFFGDPTTPRVVRDVEFWSDGNDPTLGSVSNGVATVTTQSVNAVDDWSTPGPNFRGEPISAANLREVMRDVREGNELEITVAGLEPGLLYEIITLYNEGANTPLRCFDIMVNDKLAVDNMTSQGTFPSGSWNAANSFGHAVIAQADATGEITIRLGGDLGGNPPLTESSTQRPILNGVVVNPLPRGGEVCVIPLRELRPGTGNVTLLGNGGFENGTPAPWFNGGNMQISTPISGSPHEEAFVGDQAAQSLVNNTASAGGYLQSITLERCSWYVLSAYLWNYGNTEDSTNTNVDFQDAHLNFDETQILFRAPGTDEGFFFYKVFYTHNITEWTCRAFWDGPTGVRTTRPDGIGGQWDCIAVTPLDQFIPPSTMLNWPSPLPGIEGEPGTIGVTAYYLGEVVDVQPPIENIIAILNDIQNGDIVPNDVASDQFPTLALDDSTTPGGGEIQPKHATPGGGGDDYVVTAKGTFRVVGPGTYTFNIQSDDGFAMKILGTAPTSSDRGLIDGDTVYFPNDTPNSNAQATIDLEMGDYNIEFFAWENEGGAFSEVATASGDQINDPSGATWLALGDGTIVEGKNPNVGLLFVDGNIHHVGGNRILGTDFISGDQSNEQYGPEQPVPGWGARIVTFDQHGLTLDNHTIAEGVLASQVGIEGVEPYGVIDLGPGGTFDGNHPYPNGVTDDSMSDFAVEVTANATIPAGLWTIAFGSDDGGQLNIPGVEFTASQNNESSEADQIRWEGNRGHGWTVGVFTAAEDLNTKITASFHERSGGDIFEVALIDGQFIEDANADLGWVPLSDGTFGWEVTTTTSSLLSADLTANITGTLQFDVDGDTGDLLTVDNPDPNIYTTNLNLEGATIEVLAPGNPSVGDTFQIIDADLIHGTLPISSVNSSQNWVFHPAAGTIVFEGENGLTGDFNNDGQVNGSDLFMVLLNWDKEPPNEQLNIDGDNVVDQDELDAVIKNWGDIAAANTHRLDGLPHPGNAFANADGFAGIRGDYVPGTSLFDMFDAPGEPQSFRSDTIDFHDGHGGHLAANEELPPGLAFWKGFPENLATLMTATVISDLPADPPTTNPDLFGDFFSLRATARLSIDEIKALTFALKMDDGAALRINEFDTDTGTIGPSVFWWNLNNGAQFEGGDFVGLLDPTWNGEVLMSTVLVPGEYVIEFVGFEGVGAAQFELMVHEGVLSSFGDGSQWTLVGNRESEEVTFLGSDGWRWAKQAGQILASWDSSPVVAPVAQTPWVSHRHGSAGSGRGAVMDLLEGDFFLAVAETTVTVPEEAIYFIELLGDDHVGCFIEGAAWCPTAEANVSISTDGQTVRVNGAFVGNGSQILAVALREGTHRMQVAVEEWQGATAVELNQVVGGEQLRVRLGSGIDAGTRPTATFPVAKQGSDDVVPPEIQCPASPLIVELTGPGGAVLDDFGVSATDDSGQDPELVCTPAAGTEFPLGDTEVICTATDGSDNQAICTFIVRVVDTTAPVVTCPEEPLAAECAGPQGTLVAFNVSTTDLSGAVNVDCVPPSGSLFPLGTTTVTCTATDGSGNEATCAFDVTIVDTMPPDVICPPDIEVDAQSPSGTVVSFAASAVDVCDGALPVNCAPLQSGDVFPIGSTGMTCTAIDASGNLGTCEFTVKVRSPLEMSQILVQTVEDFELQMGTETALSATLNQVTENLGQEDESVARNQLAAFINQVEAQTGKAIDPDEAETLIAMAEAILTATELPVAALRENEGGDRGPGWVPLEIRDLGDASSSGRILELRWQAGVLQESLDLDGSWRDLFTVSSPYRIEIRDKKTRFFRLRMDEEADPAVGND